MCHSIANTKIRGAVSVPCFLVTSPYYTQVSNESTLHSEIGHTAV
uniref:Uncharacterized protein n=1 Tax=Anguilla anguilla TaxID=7936 RepID=A0A0E9Q801_ANGAN